MRRILLSLPAALFFVLFYVWPLAEIIALSFTAGALSQGASPVEVLADPAYRRILVFSTYQAVLSTVLTLAVGLPAALVFARYRFFAQPVWRALATIPFVMPTVVVAAALTALLGPRGILPWPVTGTLGIILFAHVFYNVSVILRVVGAFLAGRDPQIEEAASVDGASRWQIFARITLPLASPAIGAAAATVFLFTFSSFGVVLLLGGVQFTTIEVAIYQQTAQLLRLDVSTSLALLQLLVTLVTGLISSALQRTVTQEQAGLDQRRAPRRLHERLAVGAVLTFIAVALLLPLLSLVLKSFGSSDGLFGFYNALNTNTRNSILFVPPVDAIRNSLGFALITALLSVALGLPLTVALARQSRWTRLAEAALLLPLGTSAVTLGLGYFVTFDAPIDLRASPLLLPIAHTMLALPFFVRTVLPALRSIDPALREAAATEGARTAHILRTIDLPLIAPALAAAIVFAFSISLGEFGASLLISRPECPTITVAIFRYLGQPGALNYGQAMAMSTLLMLVTAAGALFIEKMNPS